MKLKKLTIYCSKLNEISEKFKEELNKSPDEKNRQYAAYNFDDIQLIFKLRQNKKHTEYKLQIISNELEDFSFTAENTKITTAEGEPLISISMSNIDLEDIEDKYQSYISGNSFKTSNFEISANIKSPNSPFTALLEEGKNQINVIFNGSKLFFV